MVMFGKRNNGRIVPVAVMAIAFAFHLSSFTLKAQDSVAVVDLTDSLRIELVWVEGGTFAMGDDGHGDVSHSYEASRPVHQVTLHSYYIGTYEVTQALWTFVMGENPAKFRGNDSLPVEQVSWDDAQRFVTLLSQMTGRRFRLPTEAEWEYAARGGRHSRGTAYAGCNRGQLEQHAWFCVNSHGRTYPVGRRKPNELGLFDMAGNVAEWCSDWMDTYSSQPLTDPRGAAQGDSRIVRGGHYYSTSPTCAVFDRSWYVPSGKTEFYGLRVVMEADEEPEAEEWEQKKGTKQ